MLKIFALPFIAVAFLANLFGQEIKYDHTIDIISAGQAGDKTAQELSIIHDQDAYKIAYKVKHGRKTWPKAATIHTDLNFDKASYTCESDQKMAIKLFDTASENKAEIKVYATKRSSGLQVDPFELMPWKTVEITTNRDTSTTHKVYDVSIFKDWDFIHLYFYVNQGGMPEEHLIKLGMMGYTMASYRWEDEKKVFIKLSAPGWSKEYQFKAFGDHATTGMEMIKE